VERDNASYHLCGRQCPSFISVTNAMANLPGHALISVSNIAGICLPRCLLPCSACRAVLYLLCCGFAGRGGAAKNAVTAVCRCTRYGPPCARYALALCNAGEPSLSLHIKRKDCFCAAPLCHSVCMYDAAAASPHHSLRSLYRLCV